MVAAVIALVLVQVFLAGLGVFVSPGYWGVHRAVGHLFSYPIMVMLALSLAGRLPRRHWLFAVGLYALYALQYAFLRAAASPWAFVQAFHAVNALALIVLAVAALHAGLEHVRNLLPRGPVS